MYFLDTGLCAYLTDWTTPETLETGAMSGAMLETHVVSEILKSWLARGHTPQLYYYRDRDGREIDLVMINDRTLYPVEIKKTMRPVSSMARTFQALDRLGMTRGPGAVLCLTEQLLPLDTTTQAVPVGFV